MLNLKSSHYLHSEPSDQTGIMRYTDYNREERDICAHLFRLLLEDQPRWQPLCEFLGVSQVEDPRLFCEVALIRDAYNVRKPNISEFITKICDLIAEQKEIADYTKFTDLFPDKLNDPSETHPRQIRHKMREPGKQITESDDSVYGSLQAMFNAKPDLVICTGQDLYVYEVKFTLGFDQEQLKRTENIVEVWAKELYADLGFHSPPKMHIRTLMLERYKPDMSWEQVYELAKRVWGDDDFSTRMMARVENI